MPSLSTRSGQFLVIFPVAFGLFVWGLYYVSERGYLFLLREYMVVEDLQFLFYLAASALAALTAHRLLRGADVAALPRAVASRLGVLYTAGAVGLFFVAGEEVSWGQEVWERTLPFFPDKARLRSLGNKQGETTLHNMGAVDHLFSYLLFAIAVYGVLSPVVRVWFERGQHDVPAWVDYLVFPSITIAGMVVATTFFVVKAIVLPHDQKDPGEGLEAFRRFQEVAELYISFALLLLTRSRLMVTRMSSGG